MDAKQLISRMSELYDRNIQIAISKNADYANNNDPFQNFRSCELFGVPVEQGFLTRMTDKLSRIGNLVRREAAVADESVLDTLSDLANYAMLLRVWLEQKAGEHKVWDRMAEDKPGWWEDWPAGQGDPS